ncbi:hypothetical protein KBD34_04030 [Patescibacteria group bacterium]|nr:hypothetical protein [Patescibacteria group bacterium]
MPTSSSLRLAILRCFSDPRPDWPYGDLAYLVIGLILLPVLLIAPLPLLTKLFIGVPISLGLLALRRYTLQHGNLIVLPQGDCRWRVVLTDSGQVIQVERTCQQFFWTPALERERAIVIPSAKTVELLFQPEYHQHLVTVTWDVPAQPHNMRQFVEWIVMLQRCSQQQALSSALRPYITGEKYITFGLTVRVQTQWYPVHGL